MWHQHVYTLLPDERNGWNNAFPDLHVCEQRNGVDLERLKIATYHDQDKWRETNSLKPYFGFYKLLESLLVIYVESMKSIRESSAIYLCGIWCDRIKKINEQGDDSDSTVNDRKKAIDGEDTDSISSASSNKSIKKRETVTEDDVSFVVLGVLEHCISIFRALFNRAISLF